MLGRKAPIYLFVVFLMALMEPNTFIGIAMFLIAYIVINILREYYSKKEFYVCLDCGYIDENKQ